MNSETAPFAAPILLIGANLLGGHVDFSRFAQRETILNLPDGRSFPVRLELLPDGVYGHLSEEAREALRECDHAPLSATIAPGNPLADLSRDLVAFLAPVAIIKAPPKIHMPSWSEEHIKPSSKGAQRRMAKPWHGGRR